MADHAGGTGVVSASAVVDAVARRWRRIAAETCFVPMHPTQAEAEFRGHTARLLHALTAEPFQPAPAHEVGEALVAGHFAAPEFIARTVELFDEPVLAPLGVPTSRRAERGPARAARLSAVRGALVAGYTEALRDRTFIQQETLRHADLTARTELETASRSYAARFRAVFENAAFGIAISDWDGNILEANPALRTMLGYTLRQLRQRRLDELVHQDAPFAGPTGIGLRDEAGTPITGERPLVVNGGGVIWTQLTTSLISMADDEDGARYQLTVVEDVSERRRMRTRLVHQALHDPLTSLPNRALFFDRLREVLVRSGRGEPVGVLVIDINGLAAVNDSLGHEAGDQILASVADRLTEEVAREGHLVARIDGDDFAVLLAPGQYRGAADALARHIVKVLNRPFAVGQHAIPITATIGAAEVEAGGTDVSGVLRAAQTALEWAKSDPTRSWAGYEAERGEQEAARRRLAAAMPQALAAGAFQVEFQPIIALVDRRLTAAEALVRWHHPRFGVLGPDQFIPLAEETGFIVPLGRWVLAESCRRAADWRRNGGQAPIVSVNLAARQLADPGFLDEVATVLARTGLPPEALQLEITESALVGPAEAPATVLRALAASGVRIAIDDFGTGYSSLAYLRALPVHELKLAGPFIHGLAALGTGSASADDDADGADDGADGEIVGALVTLAHTLGLSVTAEGVENEAQAAQLAALGCDCAQGWHFAHPMDPASFLSLVNEPV